MQHKKRIYKRLMVIYIIYFLALAFGLTSDFLSNFYPNNERREGSASETYEYFVSAPLTDSPGEIRIEGLSGNITPSIDQIRLRVTTNEKQSFSNSLSTLADSKLALTLLLVSEIAAISMFVLFALIINSMRKSIRDEKPIPHSNIVRTRWIGSLMILAVFCNSGIQYINSQKAVELLTGTDFHVLTSFSFDYWNTIIAILFIFMGELFSIGQQMSEEQKLTI